MRRALLKLLVIFLPALLCLLALELIVRLMCNTDADGNLFFRTTELKPYQLPVKRCKTILAEYFATPQSKMMYDPELGWTPRPDAVGNNSAGFITTGPAPERLKPPGRLRIALIGDSYTQGNFQTGWWRVLEQQLQKAGMNVEVLNFGVGGYGMDQAYLRWHRDCLPWKPDIVIFGLFKDDCFRNLNMIRLFLEPSTGIPLTKPRFLLDGDGLKLINSPTPRPEEIVPLLRNFPAWPPSEHEHFYNRRDYLATWWRKSRLAALVEAKLAHLKDSANATEVFESGSELNEIALRLVRKIQSEAEEAGAKFLIVNLPHWTDLSLFCKSGRMPQEKLYDVIKSETTVIPLEIPLGRFSQGKNIPGFYYDGHFRPEFDTIAGETVARFLIEHPAAFKTQ